MAHIEHFTVVYHQNKPITVWIKYSDETESIFHHYDPELVDLLDQITQTGYFTKFTTPEGSDYWSFTRIRVLCDSYGLAMIWLMFG